MRSGTSFFDWTVFKKTICRFWPLWGMYFVIWLVALPLNGLMMLRMDSYGLDGSYMQSFAMERLPSAAGNVSLTLALVCGALAAMAVFSHLYNARSANLFGSLPVRREGLFLTHYLAGLAFLVVPNVAVFLLTLLVEAAGGFVSIEGLLFWLAVTCGEGFFFYSLAVFCAMFTGHILALPAFYAIVNCIVIGVTELLHVVLMAFYYGFSGFTEEVYDVVKWFTPVVQLDESVYGYFNWVAEAVPDAPGLMDEAVGKPELVTEGLDVVGIYAAVALVLAVCAFLLYRARRLESAGDVVSVRAMRPVFRYGVALCVGLVFGMGTVMFTGGGQVVLMIAMVVWGVIGCFAAQMLLDKSFRVFKKWKGAVAVAGVFIAMFLVVGFDLTGFETRIPDPASVDVVTVDGINAVYLGDDGDRIFEDCTDPEVIRLMTILHKEAVAQRDEEWQTQAQVGGVSTSLKLTYTLKGGGTLTRRYSVWLNPGEVGREGTAAWAVQQIYNNHEFYWQVYGFARMEDALAAGGRLDSVMFEAYVEDMASVGDVIGYGKDAQALLAAVKEDFFAGRIGVRRLDDEEHWYGGAAEASLYFTATDPVMGQGTYRVTIALQDTASSTIAELRRLESVLDNGQILEEWLKWAK